MKIAYLAAGAAGMYCGSCLHDNTLAAALLKQGEDVVLVPIYTPIRTDEKDVSLRRVFFGGINVYLQQKWALFRRTPRWLDAIFDHPALLGKLGGRASSVDPAQLGDLTVSMLQGEAGKQRKELEKLVDWLLEEVQPDVVHLSNSMMLGLARMIAERCGPPVVCSLSGEDIFTEKLQPPHYDEMRELLRERAEDVQAFVALNRYYADFMADYLAVDRTKVHVIRHGLNLEGYPREPKETAGPLRIGFLARICEDKGLHLLIEACEQLRQQEGIPPFELHVAGYLGAGDREYFKRCQSAGRWAYHGELDREGKIDFLKSLAVFSTPTVYHESKGLPSLEAMASGVPIVVPDHGSFSELIEDTRGGLLHKPLHAGDLAEKISELLLDPKQAQEIGQAGRTAIEDRYHAEEMANQTLKLYQRLVADTSKKTAS